ncbi:vanadium-dependent haloperoxidase [Pseudoalteromonas luteoviolacea]|uniref:vanadium-dependent haloperoxidase n=1 Tax=Pseudoalteromonas luteoviolacea TaxID=43657 RepID=UPI001F200E7D|nr:vanadium-dependent haloperoxidase [Pseudoalteromonas luteoviolacea]MCF6439128.1 vanadium-dependent haloperoxidase [Pseudoalteromonas luteoviolacea]
MKMYLSIRHMIYQIRKNICQVGLLVSVLFCSMHSVAQVKQDFDFDVDNAALDVVGFGSLPALREHVSANYGDASLVFRYAILLTNAWYDATAAYHPTAVGVYSHLGRRPQSEATNRNINIAVFYASYHVLNSYMPTYKPTWRKLLLDVGLDPDNNSTDITTPIGLGNVAGKAVVAGRLNDGMNQYGDVGRTFNPTPYADYTNYKPVNTAYKLKNPSRWQPDMQRKGLGLYKIQQFVTPQFALAEPYSYEDPRDFEMPPPHNSNHRNRKAYRQQAKEVLEVSANLTDELKLKAELFDDKFSSLSYSVASNTTARNLPLLDFMQFEFVVNMATFDAGIFVWQEKYRYDAVRPFSAIQKLFKDNVVEAWGGPGKGTVTMKGRDWKSYLEEADHPEYPSASTCFCYAHAQAARLYFGDDNMTFNLTYPTGKSRIEPGVTPAKDTLITYNTWSKFAEECGQSRVWGGVHFQAAVDESAEFCPMFGNLAHDYMTKLVNGTAELRAPSKGRDLDTLPERFKFTKPSDKDDDDEDES